MEVNEDNIGKLQRQIDELTRFAHMVAHDLRNPNATAYGYFEYLYESAEKNFSKEKLNIYERMGRNILNSLNLIDALLYYAKAGGDFDKESVSILSAVKDAEEHLGIRTHEKQVSLDINVDENININGSRELLSIVFANLIDNSIKYSNPTEHPHIVVNAMVDGNRVIITVGDNGLGIPPERLDDIFTEFVRVDEHAKLAKGSGIGLSTVKKIVKSHEGEISLESKINKGTTFTITFPVL